MTEQQILHAISANIGSVIKGQEPAIRLLLSAFISGGHVLLEDVPGTGKTTLAKALAKSINAEYHRVQFTPDLLPTDILGVSIFDQRDHNFHFHRVHSLPCWRRWVNRKSVLMASCIRWMRCFCHRHPEPD